MSGDHYVRLPLVHPRFIVAESLIIQYSCWEEATSPAKTSRHVASLAIFVHGSRLTDTA
jgi:hypothetical protein